MNIFNGRNGQKWQKLTFWYKWAQIYIKLMKILNLAQKLGSTGEQITINSWKVVSADTLFRIILGLFVPFLKKKLHPNHGFHWWNTWVWTQYDDFRRKKIMKKCQIGHFQWFIVKTGPKMFKRVLRGT